MKFDPLTGKLRGSRDISVYDRADHPNLATFGGAYLLSQVPEGLKAVQLGRDPAHYEIVPAAPITFEEYEALLDTIPVTPVVEGAHGGEQDEI